MLSDLFSSQIYTSSSCYYHTLYLMGHYAYTLVLFTMKTKINKLLTLMFRGNIQMIIIDMILVLKAVDAMMQIINIGDRDS